MPVQTHCANLAQWVYAALCNSAAPLKTELRTLALRDNRRELRRCVAATGGFKEGQLGGYQMQNFLRLALNEV